MGQVAAQGIQRFTRHATTRIGEIAQVAGDAFRPGQLRQLNIERRHGSQAGNLFPFDGLDDIARQQVVEQHHAGADMKGRGQLAETGIEG